MQAPLGCLRGGCSRSSVRPQSPHVEPLLFAGPFPAGFLPSLPYGDGTELPLCRGAAPSGQLAVTLLLFWGARPYFRDRLQRKWKETGRGRRSPPRGRSVQALQPS